VTQEKQVGTRTEANPQRIAGPAGRRCARPHRNGSRRGLKSSLDWRGGHASLSWDGSRLPMRLTPPRPAPSRVVAGTSKLQRRGRTSRLGELCHAMHWPGETARAGGASPAQSQSKSDQELARRNAWHVPSHDTRRSGSSLAKRTRAAARRGARRPGSYPLTRWQTRSPARWRCASWCRARAGPPRSRGRECPRGRIW